MNWIVKTGKIVIIAFFIAAILSPLATLIAFKLAWKNKIYPGIKVANIALNGLTPNQAEILLKEKISQQPHLLVIQKDERDWLLDLDQVGLRFYPNASAQKAYLFGRNQSWQRNLLNQYSAFRWGKKLPLDFAWDEEKLIAALASISAQINQPFIPTTIKIQNGQTEIQAGRLGENIASDALLAQISSRIKQNNWKEVVVIPIKTFGFLPSDQAIKNTLERAEKLKGKTLVISGKNQNLVLEHPQLIELIDFNNDWNKERVKSWIDSIASLVERPAENALFKFNEGKVEEFSPGQTGLILEKEQAANLLIQALFRLENESKEKEFIDLPIKELPPEISTADSNQFGISGLVGKGESWFFHSIASRVHNIKLASSKFDGVLIKPGEEFSFNQVLGEVSQKTGYKTAWIISGGRTVLGDGGGVCQVSTTLFRAALESGLPITERHPHAYRVSYYEYNSPPGQDATVFAPSVDFKFKNDYPCYLLIQKTLEEKQSYLAFDIFGCPDGRKVTLSKPKVWDVVPPPPAAYIDDPTLPAGAVKQIDFPAWGSKVSFDWKVTRDNQILYQKTFYSHYRAWQAVYLRGISNQ